MWEDLTRIGGRPIAAGLATAAIGLAAGWIMAGEARWLPVRLIHAWVKGVLLPGVRRRRSVVRFLVPFLNNSIVLAMLVLAGGYPGGGWAGVCLLGLAMGIALRSVNVEDVAPTPVPALPPRAFPYRLGLLLNMLEVPAIVIALGLAMGQVAAPNGLPGADAWRVFGTWVMPALAAAAAGESLWLGQLQGR